MGDQALLSRHRSVLGSLSDLPKRMIDLQNLENIAEFVLHGLCQPGCFDISQAAYIVDNPDFNCLKGIAGFSAAEAELLRAETWLSPELFSNLMRASKFNQQIRSLERASLRANGRSNDSALQEIAAEVGIANPAFCTWELKHDNYGVLIYRKPDNDPTFDEHFIKSLYLLSFCPIF